MKKIILSIAAVVFIASMACAQEKVAVDYVEKKTDFRSSMMFGIKAGANYSNVYDAQGEEFHAKAKFGLAAGIFIAIPVGKFLGIHPEVLYSQKGFQATGKILGSSYDFTRTTSYIDVPLFIALKPSEFVTILAGPQYSYLLSQKDVFATGSTNVQQVTEFKNDNIRKNLLSLAAGLDINIRHTVIGARAGWDISNNNGNGTSSTPRYKNSWLQLTLGFRI